MSPLPGGADLSRRDPPVDLDALLAAAAEAAETARRELRIPGAALAISTPDATRFRGLGVAKLDPRRPVTARTVFQTGSISKLFTALAAARLADRGELSLDRPVRDFVGPLPFADPETAARLTLRHLLEHTGGFRGDYGADTGRGDDALAKLVATLGDFPQLTPVGEVYHYSNLGYAVAGHVLAAAAGRPFERVVRDEVIGPLGLSRTGYFPEDVIFEEVAVGYHVGRRRVLPAPWARWRCRAPNGGVLSCAEDLLAFGRFMTGDGRAPDGTRLLAGGALDAMRRPGPATGEAGGARGLGWRLSDRGGVAVAFHGGATAGFRTALWAFPRRGVVAVALTNADRGARLTDAVARALRDALSEEPPTPPPTGSFSAPDAAGYAGIYLSPGVLFLDPGGSTGLRLTWFNGVIDDPVVMDLASAGPDRVEAVGEGPFRGSQGDFLRRPDGAVFGFRWRGSRLGIRADAAAARREYGWLVARRPALAARLGTPAAPAPAAG